MDIRSAVYGAVARTASPAEFESFVKLYRETEQHEEKTRLLRSMAIVRDPSLIERALAFILSDEVRSQDAIGGIVSVASSKVGREMAWSFLKEHEKLLVDRYTGNLLISRLVSPSFQSLNRSLTPTSLSPCAQVKSTLEDFASHEKAAEVEAYFASHKWPGTERSVQQAVESIRLNADWLSRDQAAIKGYLLEANK